MKITHVLLATGAAIVGYYALRRYMTPEPTVGGGVGKIIDGAKDLYDALSKGPVIGDNAPHAPPIAGRDVTDGGSAIADGNGANRLQNRMQPADDRTYAQRVLAGGTPTPFNITT